MTAQITTAVETETHELVLHGHRVNYRAAGEGPPLVLLHGITSSSETWLPVMSLLARNYRVIAPDLLGHGDSAKPRGDYSLGANASGVRDLLAALGHDHVTVVGHSMGGGVALQYAYQFPERIQRLVLVSSGGFGREVSIALRAAALPGAELVLPLICNRRLLDVGGALARIAEKRVGSLVPPSLREVARGYASLADARARAAFLHTLRCVVDPAGQRVNASDRLYLASDLPTMLIWGVRDAIIPVAHAYDGHELIPGSRLEIFERSGHFPHSDEPSRFVEVLEDFLATTAPAHLHPDDLRERLLRGDVEARTKAILPDIVSA